jgi:polyhydroxyalkanoate synthase subunit PhaC
VATGPRAATQAGLDVMLTDAAIEPGTAARLVRPGAAARLAGRLARRPERVARRAGGFGADLARIAAGNSQLTPPKGDRRFGDRAWQESWLFHRLMQGYLARRRCGRAG